MVTAALAGCAEMNSLLDSATGRKPSRTVVREVGRDEPRPGARNESRAEARNEARNEARAEAGRDQAALREGVRLYNEGDFNGAIKRLSSNDIRANSPTKIRVEALKYQAFSYCVTSRPKQCEQAFEKALKIDPDFTLDSGEQGHPLWGPVFERAKNR
ncbi:TssQ family T6SS-associated lipoprotein [Massilia litorea]|uniref:TssQ family T6SS-associated lipoprotein n=2 Tax=Massilia litorea TaxID=2769491 RepID=A0A7L9UB48_9BURK|nr:TssQ family T6SS-associated lipoprotein [Massilia litorea]